MVGPLVPHSLDKNHHWCSVFLRPSPSLTPWNSGICCWVATQRVHHGLSTELWYPVWCLIHFSIENVMWGILHSCMITISFPPARGARRCGSRSSRRTAASGWAPRGVQKKLRKPPKMHAPFCHNWGVTWPIGSMYGIYANIGGIWIVNVTIYGIHGSYGWCYYQKWIFHNISKSRLFFNYKTWDVLWVLRSKVKLSLRMPPGNLRWGVEFFLLMMGKYVGDDFPTWWFSVARLYYHRMRCLGDTQVTIPMRWDPCSQLLYDIIHQWFPGSFVVHLPPNSIDRNEHLPTHEQAYSINITFWLGWPLLKTTETDECSLFKIWKHLRIPGISDISCKPRIFRTRFEHA